MALIDEFEDLFQPRTPADVADTADNHTNSGQTTVADTCGYCGQSEDIRTHPQLSANAKSRTSISDPQNPQVPQAISVRIGRSRLTKLSDQLDHPLDDLLDWYVDDLIELGELPEQIVHSIVKDYVQNAFAYRRLISGLRARRSIGGAQ